MPPSYNDQLRQDLNIDDGPVKNTRPTNPLMEDFTIDSNSVRDTRPLPVPLLFSPAYKRIYGLVTVARTATLLLNLCSVVVLMFGFDADPFDSALLPITIFSTFFCFVPTLLPLIFHISLKTALAKRSQSVREEPGSKRNAVLVEDPITGEQRWMLEVEPKKKSEDASPGRVGFLMFDLITGGIIIISAGLCIRYRGTKNTASLICVLVDRFVTL